MYFALSLKPIIFIAFDLDAYKQTRGINFDYNALVSGPFAKDWNNKIIQKVPDVFECKGN